VIGLVDLLLPRKRGVVIRTFPDFDDQGLELARALRVAGAEPVIWLVTGHPGPAPDGLDVVAGRSLRGVLAYGRARVVAHTHGLYRVPPRSRRKTFVNLWHGMPVKRLEPEPAVARRQTDLVTVTSRLHGDHLRETWGVGREVVVETGLPRNDRMVRAATESPPLALDEIAGERPLVVWLPTYRRSVTGDIRLDGDEFGNCFEFPGADDASVAALADRLGVQVLVKPHPMAPPVVTGSSRGLTVWDDAALADRELTLYEVLGHATVLLTDHSSVWVDYLLVDRPLVFTIGDLERYADTRGHYFVPLADHLPGPIATDLASLEAHLADALGTDPWAERRRELRWLHHTHLDGDSADRVAALVLDRLGTSRRRS
jgi:CDP-glycerol glycerophosphotransferase (TagB/SpsB family)